MAPSELDNFVLKFRQLWSDGYTAHLDIDTHAGKAWVGLRVQLESPKASQSHRSNARQRRRARRAAARAAENPTSSGNVMENVSQELDIDKATEGCVNNKETEKDLPTENVVVQIDTDDVPCDVVAGTNEIVADEATKPNETIETATLVPDEVPTDMVDAPASVKDQNGVDNVKPTVPDIISVYCIATLENCPDSVLNQEYGDSIRRFIHSEHHLAENIASTELNHMSSRSSKSNTYVHTVSVILKVKTSRLWESPSKYVRKHLGLDNYWTRSNGTVVKLSRIHQRA